MWAFLIGLAAAVVKTFATAAASAAGAKLGESLISHAGAQAQQSVVTGSQSSATPEARISASRQLLDTLKADAAFRDEVREILAEYAPAQLAEGETISAHLGAHPRLVDDVVSGSRSVTDFGPLSFWKYAAPLSGQQIEFVTSPTFHKVCPANGEGLSMGEDVTYEARVFNTVQSVSAPTGSLLPFPPQSYHARCVNGHSWPVFAH